MGEKIGNINETRPQEKTTADIIKEQLEKSSGPILDLKKDLKPDINEAKKPIKLNRFGELITDEDGEQKDK